MGEARNRNIRIGIVDNDPYALKVFGALIERMSSDFAVIWTCDLGAVAISRCLSPTKRPDVLVTDMSMGRRARYRSLSCDSYQNTRGWAGGCHLIRARVISRRGGSLQGAGLGW